jgi:hypothetical protein
VWLESSFTPTATLAQTQLPSSANSLAAAPVSDAHWYSDDRNDLSSSLMFVGDDCGCLMLKLCQGRADEISGLVQNHEGMIS